MNIIVKFLKYDSTTVSHSNGDGSEKKNNAAGRIQDIAQDVFSKIQELSPNYSSFSLIVSLVTSDCSEIDLFKKQFCEDSEFSKSFRFTIRSEYAGFTDANCIKTTFSIDVAPLSGG